MFAFSLTIFWGACLLFLVQPLIARFILPWFGGGPAVWTTCMLFFQVLLLGGYAYAHFSISRLTPRRQVITHLCLLALAVALLPITPSDQWKPTDGSHAAGHILLLLLACLGLPYLVLSATGPLLQAWFSKANPGVSPYRLYALSNVGSLLALLVYPFVLEPQLARQAQANWWSVGLALYAGLAGWCGYKVWKSAGSDLKPTTTDTDEETPTLTRRLLWFALPACGVMLLLAITNKLCQDIAVVPFLWVLPLSLYLLSFIISFDSPRWYHRGFWLPLLVFFLGTVTFNLQVAESHPSITPLATIYLSTIFVACMVCHGEVFRLRPSAKRLTSYYLSISAGGAVGGLFVALVAPFIFPDYFELHLALFLTAALVILVVRQDPTAPFRKGVASLAWMVPFLALAALGYYLADTATNSLRGAVSVTRGFYGVLKVTETDKHDPARHLLTIQHGATIHGLQYQSAERRTDPTSYYTSTSGIGRLFRSYKPEGGRRVGAVGLGSGTLAAWGRKGDTFRFYEINDDVARLATSTFTYLKDSKAKTELVMGDARLRMEGEKDQQYDVIILDAFSSDAIPVHLLTKEAFAVYLQHLQPDGVIAVHISNRYLDLQPVVERLAAEFGLSTACISDDYTESWWFYDTTWMLVTKNKALLAKPDVYAATDNPKPNARKAALWTDDNASLYSIMK